MRTNEDIDLEMEKVYPPFRQRWCEAKPCFCLGCVNNKIRITKKEWELWKKRHPSNSDFEAQKD